MRLFFTLITFFLTFNSYALAEDKFSANPRRCLDENANYNKIIEKSNETIKLWTEVKAYDWLFEDLLFLHTCYKKTENLENYFKIYSNLIDKKIITPENIYSLNFKDRTNPNKDELSKNYFNQVRILLNLYFFHLLKFDISQNWNYHVTILKIFEKKPNYFNKKIYEHFIFGQYHKIDNPETLDYLNKLLDKMIDNAEKNNDYEYFFKFSEKKFEVLVSLTQDYCISFYDNELKNRLNEKNIWSVKKEVRKDVQQAAVNIIILATYCKNDFVDVKKNYLKLISLLDLFILDHGVNSDIDRNAHKYNRLTHTYHLSDVYGGMGDKKNKKIFKDQFYDKLEQYSLDPFYSLKINELVVQDLLTESKFKEAENNINLALKKIEELNFEEFEKYQLINIEKVFLYEQKMLRLYHLEYYAKILQLSGRNLHALEIYKKITMSLEALKKNNPYGHNEGEMLASTSMVTQLPIIYTTLLKTYGALYEIEEGKKIMEKGQKHCEQILNDPKLNPTHCYLFLNEKAWFLIHLPKNIEEKINSLSEMEKIINFFSKIPQGKELLVRLDYEYLNIKAQLYGSIYSENKEYVINKSDGKSISIETAMCDTIGDWNKLILENKKYFKPEQFISVITLSTVCHNFIKSESEGWESDYVNKIFPLFDYWTKNYEKVIKQGNLTLNLNKYDTTNTGPHWMAYMLSTFNSKLYDKHAFSKEERRKINLGLEKIFVLLQHESGIFNLNARKKIAHQNIDEELLNLLNEKQRLTKKLDFNLNNFYSNLEKNIDSVNFLNTKTEIENKIKQINNKINKNYRSLLNLNKSKTYQIKEIKEVLKDDEVLIYLSNYSSVFILLIDNKNIASDVLVRIQAGDFPTDVFLIRDALNIIMEHQENAKVRDDFNKLLNTHLAVIYELLLKNIEPYFENKKNIYIVADKFFSGLPFEMLITNRQYGFKDSKKINDIQIDQDQGFKPSYLVEKHNISYFPNIEVFMQLKLLDNKSITDQSAFLGIGNPKFKDDKEANIVESKIDKISKILLNRRGYISNSNIIRERYEELPFTETELKSMMPLFKSSDLFTKREANEAKIKKLDLKNYDVISFATHAEVSGSFKGFNEPFLVLTPPKNGSEINDGLLTSSEISELDLDARLVILSACNTASKEHKYAQGFSGLINSFFMAGTDAVIATHWPVADESGYLLMSETIKKIISQNISKAKALRMTKLEFIEGKYGKEYKHPFFWAPYILVGN